MIAALEAKDTRRADHDLRTRERGHDPDRRGRRRTARTGASSCATTSRCTEITTDDAGTTATLSIGPDLWPFPASIVKDDAGWHFDAESAREEVLAAPDRPERARRDRPAARLRPGAGRLPRRGSRRRRAARTFADAIISDAGKRDGLYWPAEPGAPESPIGDFMARAAADGYNFDGTDEEPEPYLGYYYRVLTKQGAARARRGDGLHGQRPHGRRPRAARLPGRLRRHRGDELHGRRERRGLRGRPRRGHARRRRRHRQLRSRRRLVAGRPRRRE